MVGELAKLTLPLCEVLVHWWACTFDWWLISYLCQEKSEGEDTAFHHSVGNVLYPEWITITAANNFRNKLISTRYQYSC